MLHTLFYLAVICIGIYAFSQIAIFIFAPIFGLFAIIVASIGIFIQQWLDWMKETLKLCAELRDAANEDLENMYKKYREE